MSRLRFTDRKYALKLMFTAFIGTHIPLIGLIIYLLIAPSDTLSRSTCLLLILGLTLAGTALTFRIIYALVKPVKLAQRSLSNFLRNKTLPNLPEGYDDEVGVLMRHINYVATHMQETNADTLLQLKAAAAQIQQSLNRIVDNSLSEETTTYTQNIQTALDKQLELINALTTKNSQQ